MRKIQLMQEDGTIKIVKETTYNFILCIPFVAVIAAMLYFKPETLLYLKPETLIIPLELLISSISLIGLTIIELCRNQLPMIVGLLAIGISTWIAEYSIKKLKSKLRSIKE